jgi:hypothetical protein
MKVSDDQVEAALHYLNDSVVDAAKAKAERVYVEEFKKVLLAKLMKKSTGFNSTAAAQERDALADPEYEAHLEAIQEAVLDDTEHYYRRVAAEATIQAWQTQSANERGALKVV